MMLMQSVIIILCIPVLAGVLSASLKFGYMLESLDLCQVNQQVSFLLPGMILYDKVKSNFNDNMLKGLPSFFSSYLAGLIEGDGNINVPLSERSPKGKLNYPSIQIAFAIKDMPLAQYIKDLIGHGFIHVKRNGQSCVYTVNNVEGLIRMVTILKGQLRGGKIAAFHRLIAYINTKANMSIELLPANMTPLSSNSWLTGFTDSDGSFQVRTSLQVKDPRIALSFELSQASMDNYGTSNHFLLEPIGLLFNTNVLAIRQSRFHPQYRVMAGSLNSLLLVREYFEAYPLMSSKRSDFADWCKIHNYIKQGTQMSNVEEILAIKEGMNSKRNVFNFDHLSVEPRS